VGRASVNELSALGALAIFARPARADWGHWADRISVSHLSKELCRAKTRQLSAQSKVRASDPSISCCDLPRSLAGMGAGSTLEIMDLAEVVSCPTTACSRPRAAALTERAYDAGRAR